MDHTTKGIEEDSVADSIGSIDNAPTLELHHDGLTIDGYSRAAVQTYWRVAELKIGFDLGAQPLGLYVPSKDLHQPLSPRPYRRNPRLRR